MYITFLFTFCHTTLVPTVPPSHVDTRRVSPHLGPSIQIAPKWNGKRMSGGRVTLMYLTMLLNGFHLRWIFASYLL